MREFRLVGFPGYARLWADRRVRTLFVATFFARIPNLAVPLVITLLVLEEMHGAYAQAGFIAAVETVGAAVGAPWRGRLIDRIGLRRTLVPTMIAVTFIYPAVAFASYAWLVPLAFLAGVFLIPIFTVVRLALAAMVEEEQRRTAFAADSIVAEASFLIGPAAGAMLATQASPVTAVIVIGACEVFAGAVFFWLNPPMRSVRDDVATSPAAARRWLTMPVLFVFLVSAGSVVALMGTDLAIIAQLRELDEVGSIWLVFLFWGVSSLVGGVVYGALPMSVRPTHLLLLLGLFTVPIGVADSVWTLGLWIIPAGFLCAPTMTAATEAVVRLVPEHRRGEATGWQGTAFTVGGAASAPVLGLAIDGVGAWGGFALGGAVAVGIALLSYGGQLALRVAQTKPRVAQIRRP